MHAVPAPPPAARSRRFVAAGIADTEEAPDGHDGSDMDAGNDAEPGRSSRRGSSSDVVSFYGELERVRVMGNWAIGTLLTADFKNIKVVGAALVDLVEGGEYELRGRTKVHPIHGESVEVLSAAPYISPNKSALVRFVWKNYKGIGPARAERFVNEAIGKGKDQPQALEALRQQLLHRPWELDLTSVAKNATFQPAGTPEGEDESTSAAMALYVQRDLALRLGGIEGLRDSVIKALARHLCEQAEQAEPDNSKGARPKQAVLDPDLPAKCWSLLSKNPYAPIGEVEGYGFGTADQIGRSLGIDPLDPNRLAALVAYAMKAACERTGHSFLFDSQLHDAVARVDARAGPDVAIESAMKLNKLVCCTDFAGPARYYEPKLLQIELHLARGVARLCERATPLIADESPAAVGERVKKASATILKGRGEIDESQLNALVGILCSSVRLHTLTAGPGCGKTALMEILCAVLKDKSFTFMAPTGKAAKVLSNRLTSVSQSASTIHSRLRGSGAADFMINEFEPMTEDIAVVDESSMLDLALADAVVRATGAGQHLILLGDPDQLPSIAQGNVLQDLLRVDSVDHHRLTTTHRNRNGILRLVQEVRSGSITCNNLDGVTFSHGLGDAQNQFDALATRYLDSVNEHGFARTAFLMSQRKGDVNTPGWNTTWFNSKLQQLCNPEAEKIPGTRLHVGDRIIIKANMSVPRAGQAPARRNHDADEDGGDESEQEERVVNGDTGEILMFEREVGNPRNLGAKFVRLHLDDGRQVDFPGQALEALQHSYALTVHAGQGSEYANVMMVATAGVPSFINRSMFYTAQSRPRLSLYIHGNDADIKKIVATPAPARQSALIARIKTEMGVDLHENDATAPLRESRSRFRVG